MKKFLITDEDGKDYNVEEVETKEESTTKDEASELTSDEIESLKKLAANADKLIALLEIEKEEHKDETDVLDEDEDKTETDVEIDADKEDVVDTDKLKSTCDSKRSIGAIERKHSNDSIDVQDEIAIAWANRYNRKGGND